MSRSITLGLAALVALAGCAVTDTGNPPLSPPDTAQMGTMFLAAGQVTVFGTEGALSPGEGIVRIVDLTSVAAPIDAPVRTDGSFTTSFGAESDAIFRVQHITAEHTHDERRSAPIDLASPDLVPVPDAPGCVTIARELVVRPGEASAALALTNDCADEVALSARSRRAASPLVTAIDAPGRVAPSGMATLDVSLGEDDTDEVLLIEITAPEVATRAVTVRVLAD
ncbi:MAG: hypothetical protein AB7S26_37440 [Sandaracinaceae bacterium]